MALWGGRFSEKIDADAFSFNESFSFDKRLYKYDIKGSLAHLEVLLDAKIIDKEEKEILSKNLLQILKDIDENKINLNDFIFCDEDIHSFVERILIERVGEVGKKLHTSRSRNDQVALDMKLYIRDEIIEIENCLNDLVATFEKIKNDNKKTIIPGFTHLQKAQPTTLCHYMDAFIQMFCRDKSRLETLKDRMNECPLGSCAFAGTTYNIDRKISSDILNFNKPTENSMDSVSDRDYILELASSISIISMHLSRLSEEMIIWNSNEYKFIKISDKFSTGSSIMPQKKNPDMFELIRGKTGRVYGNMIALFTMMKSLPLAYNKDMQEDKEQIFDSIDTIKSCINITSQMFKEITFNKEIMEKSAKNGFTNATDVADYLVEKGIPFREAHKITGELVLYAEKKDISLDEISLDEYKKFSDSFDSDIYDKIELLNIVKNRKSFGAPGAMI